MEACAGSARSGEGAFSVSEYNAIFGEPVWDDISPTQWRVAERLATQTGFQRKENTLGGPRSHSPRGWQNKLARDENSDGPNAHTPHQVTSVRSLSDMAASRPVAERCA